MHYAVPIHPNDFTSIAESESALSAKYVYAYKESDSGFTFISVYLQYKDNRN